MGGPKCGPRAPLDAAIAWTGRHLASPRGRMSGEQSRREQFHDRRRRRRKWSWRGLILLRVLVASSSPLPLRLIKSSLRIRLGGVAARAAVPRVLWSASPRVAVHVHGVSVCPDSLAGLHPIPGIVRRLRRNAPGRPAIPLVLAGRGFPGKPNLLFFLWLACRGRRGEGVDVGDGDVGAGRQCRPGNRGCCGLTWICLRGRGAGRGEGGGGQHIGRASPACRRHRRTPCRQRAGSSTAAACSCALRDGVGACGGMTSNAAAARGSRLRPQSGYMAVGPRLSLVPPLPPAPDTRVSLPHPRRQQRLVNHWPSRVHGGKQSL